MTEESSENSKSYISGIQTWSLVIIILLLIPGAYAFLYFADRDDYLTNRYFRALGELDLQINQNLVGLDQLLEFALHPEISPSLCIKKGNSDQTVCDDYERYLRQFSDRFSEVKFGNKGECKEVSAVMPIVGDKTYFEINGIQANRKVEAYECTDVKSKENGDKTEKQFVSVTVALRKLIDPTAALQFFDQVLLLDSGGNVVYRSGKDDLSQTENISARDDYARFENLGHYLRNQTTREVDLSNGIGNFSVDKKSSMREISHSTIREATIGKIDYLLFIQPFHPVREQAIANSTDDGDSNNVAGRVSYLVGVVPYDEFFLNIVSLPFWKIANLFLLFLFLLALAPHLKLFFSGSHFMPNRIFAWWLGISFPLLVIVICNAWLAWDQYDELENSMDREAEYISGRLKANFNQEIHAVMQETLSTREALSNDSSDVKNECDGSTEAENSLFYPVYGVAYFLNGKGEIIGCSKNNRTVNMRTEASVSKRRYFKIPGYHPELLFSWKHNNENDEADNKKIKTTEYYSERIQSYDHGLKLTALSFPVKENAICSLNRSVAGHDPNVCVFTVVKLIQSFFAPILPLGFGFAVISDHSGEVYYHSNDQRSLVENFYIETDQDPKFIAAVQSRHSQNLSGSYHAHRHRFYTAPLEGTPWSLVVFYDTSSIELANMRTVLLSILYSTSITVFGLLISLLVCAIFPGYTSGRIRWLLPNGLFTKRVIAQYLSSRLGQIWKQGFHFIYIGSGITILFLIFGSITWISFFLAGKNQIDRLQRFNLLHSGQAISERMDSIDREQQRLGLEPGNVDDVKYIDCNKLLEYAIYYPNECKVGTNEDSKFTNCQLLLEEQPTPVSPFEQIKTENVDGPPNRESLFRVDRFLPVFNEFDANYLQMRYMMASDNSWYFPAEDSEYPSLYILNSDSNRYSRIYSSHPVPHTHPGSAHEKGRERKVYLFIAFLTGLFVLYRLGRLTARRLMGLALPDPNLWAEQILIYRQKAPIKMPENGSYSSDQARENLTTIMQGDTPELNHLRAILYSRARNRIINTYSVKPVMWLILSGILKNENGLDFREPAMKEWVRQQPLRQETREFYAAQSSDMWRIVAPAFYAVLLLGFILITMSGGKIGDFLMGIVPIVFAGGIPAVVQMIRDRLK